MSHRLRTVALHRTGSQQVDTPENSTILAVTTIGNGPAMILSTDDPAFSTSMQRARFDVLDLGLGENVAGPPDAEFVGYASTGTRAWAVFRAA